MATATPARRREARTPIRAALEDRMAVRQAQETERWQAIESGMVTTNGLHPIIAQMNEAQHLGTLDSVDGVGRIYRGTVGGEPMWAQVSVHEQDAVISFWAVNDGRYRRVLVTMGRWSSSPVCWLAIGVRAILHTGKYAKAANSILGLRARETDLQKTDLQKTNLQKTNLQKGAK